MKLANLTHLPLFNRNVKVSFIIRAEFNLIKDNLEAFKEFLTQQLVTEFNLPESKMIQNLEVREGSIIVQYSLEAVDGSNASVSDIASYMESKFKSGGYKITYKGQEFPIDAESPEFSMLEGEGTTTDAGSSSGSSSIIIAVVVILLIVCIVGVVVGYLVYRRRCAPNQSTAKYMRSENGPEVSFSTDTYSLPAPENA
ncbi:uncharacterized protein [Ptychodera flava]|uniref:uncharacterized protein n=1 Tax=Ptychodera flava TaxID=63121 RepID=UPI00396AB118